VRESVVTKKPPLGGVGVDSESLEVDAEPPTPAAFSASDEYTRTSYGRADS
jgi:hypothetical protein